MSLPIGYENWPQETQFRYVQYCKSIETLNLEQLRQITKEVIAYQIAQELAFKAAIKRDFQPEFRG